MPLIIVAINAFPVSEIGYEIKGIVFSKGKNEVLCNRTKESTVFPGFSFSLRLFPGRSHLLRPQ
jgi:hypothetical protein